MGKIKELLKVGSEEATQKAINGTQEAMILISILGGLFSLVITTIYVYQSKQIMLWVGLILAYRGLIPLLWSETKNFYGLFLLNLKEERKLRSKTNDKLK